MILTKTPLRISFLGGGTDFPWFFEKHGGAVISSTIARYIYISCLPSYDQKTTYLKYSRLEQVTRYEQINHPIFRSVLHDYQVPPMDWSVMADIPAGNGLASSSAFTVGLVKAAGLAVGNDLSDVKLGLEAVRFEIDVLREPIGMQDQLASAVGGFNLLQFEPSRRVLRKQLIENSSRVPFDLVLAKVGAFSRNASKFTKAQESLALDNPEAIENLERLRDLTLQAASAIERDPSELARFIRSGWDLKMKTNPSATSAEIEETLKFAFSKGAEAGKLVGAGGSGFVLLLVDKDHTNRLLESFTRRDQRAFIVDLEMGGSQRVNLG